MKKKDLRQLSRTVRPTSFLDYRDYLSSLYRHLKAVAEGYTYARFAEDLGFSATNVLHHVIRGRRPLTEKGAKRIVEALKVTGPERNYLLTLVRYNNARSAAEREESFQKLLAEKEKVLAEPVDKDRMDYFTEWFHPVIGEMTRMEGFRDDPEWIAKMLRPPIRPEQAQKSLDLLRRLGIITYDEKAGRHVRTDANPSTGHEAKGHAIARYHQKMIENGREAVTRFSKHERDVSTVTLCLDEKSFQKLKGLVHQFQMEALSEDEDNPGGDKIYQMNIQLFPFTHKIEGGGDED